MYKVLNLNTGDVIYADRILYVKKNQTSGAWIQTNVDEAEACAIGGHLYNLPDKSPIPELHTAIIKNLDVAANLQRAENNISQNSADVDNLVSAVCDVGDETDMLFHALLELSDRLETSI